MYKKRKSPSNRSRILECIYRNAPISRTEVAEITGITPATVTNTVALLIAEGALAEVGEVSAEEASSGRKRVLLDLVPNFSHCIGVEFTRTGLVVCLCDMKGNDLFQRIIPFTDLLREQITEQIISVVNQIIDSTEINWEQIIGIGIAVPGLISQDGSTMITNRKLWVKFDLDKIRRYFPVPVIMENHVRCMALSQYLFNAANIPDNFTLFHAGIGMFCASLTDGELMLGSHQVAGEIGHTIVNENGTRCECGKKGCLVTYTGEISLVNKVRILYDGTSNTILHDLVSSRDDITMDTILTAYTAGDKLIGTVVDDALKYLSISISNLAITMNPSKIFLHGRLFEHKLLQTELTEHIKRELVFIEGPNTNRVEFLPYSAANGAKGGCALVIQKIIL